MHLDPSPIHNEVPLSIQMSSNYHTWNGKRKTECYRKYTVKKEEQKEWEKKDTAELYDMLTEPNC